MNERPRPKCRAENVPSPNGNLTGTLGIRGAFSHAGHRSLSRGNWKWPAPGAAGYFNFCWRPQLAFVQQAGRRAFTPLAELVLAIDRRVIAGVAPYSRPRWRVFSISRWSLQAIGDCSRAGKPPRGGATLGAASRTALILRSALLRASRRIAPMLGLMAILRDAMLRMAPQDEVTLPAEATGLW
jgi:hypothetical protein